ncbi:hypothetical protein NKI79_28160 [Mesorhizobium sp. M0340]|uniref:hypothetical protein n=1 Tax=Mesorhizobium sp. M0340 TaxID=2956939 RepID=UPI0033377C47
MSDAGNNFANVTAMHPEAVLLKEGGQPVILLPAFRFMAGDQPYVMDLLLVPFFHTGYITRLFFERKIENRASNWNEHRVVERNWWAPSWNHVPETMPWTKMLSAHLRAVA